MLFNIGGTLLLVGGTLASWYGMRRVPHLRYRAGGLLLITAGAVVVATGGSLVGVLNMAANDILAITNACGAAIMLAGVWLADRSPASATKAARTSPPSAGIGSAHQ